MHDRTHPPHSTKWLCLEGSGLAGWRGFEINFLHSSVAPALALWKLYKIDHQICSVPQQLN